jgi:hypothetical protein
MTDLARPFRFALLALLAAASPFAAGCSAAVDPSAEQPEEDVSTDNITSVVHSSVKNQSIGNCWIYAHVGWVESLNKRATNTELNLSESYATYWDWFTKITSWPDTALSDKGEFSAGGTWSLFRWEVARYGAMLESDFIPEEANDARSSRQGSAIRAITASLKDGALKTVEARRDRKLVRAELDKAFGLSPEVVKKLDDVFGQTAAGSATGAGSVKRKAAGVLGPTDIAIAWPNVRNQGADATGKLSDAVAPSGPSIWNEVKYPEDATARRTYQIRVQKALHDHAPVLTWWNVDFNALSGSKFTKEQLDARGKGRTGGHMTLGFDYQAKLADGTVLKAGVDVTDRTVLQKALSPDTTIEFLRVKNSWGGTGLPGVESAPPSGYYDLDMAYLDAKVADGYGLVAVILPPGY